MVKGILKRIAASTIAAAMVFSTISTINLETVKAETRAADYGVGKGVVWPEQTFAPFVDMVAWTSTPGYNLNGVAYLPKLSEETGVKFFNLGFIQGVSGTTSNGKVKWGWGGYEVLTEGGGHSQYEGIKQSIKEIREMGGDVTISFGGLNGTPFWDVTQDVDILYNTYKEIVEGYGLTRIDLDIEGGARDKTKNIANAKAIKKLQDETGVEVVLTVPVLPDGLTSLEIGLMDAYLSAGVDIKMVNIMAMCYGSATLLPGEDYGTGSVRAIDSTAKQIKDCYKQYANTELTDAQAYRKVGVTTSIGLEGQAHPIFTTAWTELVVSHAIEKGIGMTSFWSLNRDAQLQTNSGIYGKYEHTKINLKFGSQEAGTGGGGITNSKPVLSGVENKTITVGDSFDKMSGVTATDKEDGVITSKVTVSGSVNTSVAGDYTLTYSVTDANGATTTATRVITVKEKAQNSEDVNNDGKVDVTDLSLVAAKYNMKSNDYGYENKYDINNDGIIDLFDIVKVAKKVGSTEIGGGDDNDNPSGDAWASGVNYKVGDTVTYQGKTYKCLIGHTSNEGWVPGVAFTIWQEI